MQLTWIYREMVTDTKYDHEITLFTRKWPLHPRKDELFVIRSTFEYTTEAYPPNYWSITYSVGCFCGAFPKKASTYQFLSRPSRIKTGLITQISTKQIMTFQCFFRRKSVYNIGVQYELTVLKCCA